MVLLTYSQILLPDPVNFTHYHCWGRLKRVMRLTGNTVLITGGGTGIGRALAEQLHKLGNQVIITGRRAEMLQETATANPGIEWTTVDLTDPAAIRNLSACVLKNFPALNVLVNNAGIMRAERLVEGNLQDAEEIVATNLLAPIRLTAAMLPHLALQPSAAILNVSSALGFLPLAERATYCATKAAVHSYTQSLRYQLRATSVEVLELIPPYVQTNLMTGANDPRAMPLPQFISEVMDILKQDPTPKEILVENARRLRYAEKTGASDAIFEGMNQAMKTLP